MLMFVLKVNIILVCVYMVCFFDCCNCYPSYQNIIPNGNKVPHPCRNSIWSGVGHTHPSGGGALNPFGIALYQNKVDTGKIWSKKICESDTDGDGLTNGQELGDPLCQWTENGDLPETNTTVTHPGICDPVGSERCEKRNEWLKCDQNTFTCPTIQHPDVKSFNLRVPETKIQQYGSKYMCTNLHVELDGDYHVIAMTPFIDNKEVVHHMILFGCRTSETPLELNSPSRCESMEGPESCTTLRAWSIGINGDCFPDQYGIPVGDHGYTYFMLQMHYHNYDNRVGLTDSSGMTLYYTPRLRQYNSVIITVGLSGFELAPGKENVQVDGVCAGPCTKQYLKGPIFIESAINHMHALGRKQKIELYRNGSAMNIITDHSFSFQKTTVTNLQKPVKVLPGDEIRTTCVYDTRSRNQTITFGRGTDHEMCFGFLTVYPAENLPFKLMCYSWHNIPYCLLETLFDLAQNINSNPLMKFGFQSIIKSIFKKG